MNSKRPIPIPTAKEKEIAHSASEMTLQDKRRKLQANLKQKKLDKKRSMGLLPPPVEEEHAPRLQENLPHPSSMEFLKTLNPIPKKKKRSPSPNVQAQSIVEDTLLNSVSPVRSKQRVRSLSPSPPIKSHPAKLVCHSKSPEDLGVPNKNKRQTSTNGGEDGEVRGEVDVQYICSYLYLARFKVFLCIYIHVVFI